MERCASSSCPTCTAPHTSVSTGRYPTSTPGTRRSMSSPAISCISSPKIGSRSGEQARQIARGYGAGEQETLGLVALIGAQGARLLSRFDSLGHDFESQVVAEGNDRTHDGCIVRFGGHVFDE